MITKIMIVGQRVLPHIAKAGFLIFLCPRSIADLLPRVLFISLQVNHRNFRAPDGLFMALLYSNSPSFASAQFLR